MGIHALSISPILVIDDNLILEDLYVEFESMKPVVLTSWDTKACDASRATIYRANIPTIYARVNELEFHCIYCQD